LSYKALLRRRRDGKTDYRRRRQLVVGRRPFVTVFVGGKNVLVQIHEAKPQGDLVLVSSHSKQLERMGWRASRKSIPASYLTGYLAGLKAITRGVGETVLYTGVKNFVAGSRVAAAVKGLRDAGLKVLSDPATFPSEERLRGEHVSRYLESIKSPTTQFSALVNKGFDAQKFRAHIDELKSTIMKVGVKL